MAGSSNQGVYKASVKRAARAASSSEAQGSLLSLLIIVNPLKLYDWGPPACGDHQFFSTTWPSPQHGSFLLQGQEDCVLLLPAIYFLFTRLTWLHHNYSQEQSFCWLTQSQLTRHLNYICKIHLPLPYEVIWTREWYAIIFIGLAGHLILSKTFMETFGSHQKVLEIWSCPKFPHFQNFPGFG